MRLSWRIARIAGIDVYVHPTFFLVLAIPGVLDEGVLGLFVLASAFGCVLLHEFGHALMARRFGIVTEDITLYPIGGVAKLQRMPRSPGAELAIALAGPAVNFVLIAGLGLVWASGIFRGTWEMSPAEFYVVNMLVINAMLALFNLIPAFPMDGGRVLRALLSGWMGRVRATILAAGIGRLLAVMFGLYSVLYAGDPLKAVLAVFIYVAAGAELNSVLREERQRIGATENRQASVPPPGFRWVSVGDGLWRLAPLHRPTTARDHARWL